MSAFHPFARELAPQSNRVAVAPSNPNLYSRLRLFIYLFSSLSWRAIRVGLEPGTRLSTVTMIQEAGGM
jgi:hypothetical protein